MSGDLTRTTTGPAYRGLPVAVWLLSAAVLLVFVGMGVLLMMWLFGMRYEKLPTGYGRRRGGDYEASVGGTAVLADMFQAKGHKVRSISRLTPKIDQATVIVWIPDDFSAPADEARAYLESWLQTRSGRTVIFVGRDFNPAARYWREAVTVAPLDRQDEMQREYALSDSQFAIRRAAVTDDDDAGWYFTDADKPPKDKITRLTGKWADGVDSAATDIHLDVRMAAVPAKESPQFRFGGGLRETLLAGDGEPLVTQLENNDSRLILVQNGSFLLNYPLVNHEHRKIAGRLIEHCDSPGEVMFLEGSCDPQIIERDLAEKKNLFDFFAIWPLNAIVVHLAIFGFTACLAVAPIFGKPAELPLQSAADFGQHVAALGKLLLRTGDRAYALQKLQQYRRTSQRGSGKGHRPAAEPSSSEPGKPSV